MNVNIYNPYVREELELYHHGIAGQRWGSRNGPPYPLSAGAHSASEKKAGWRKSLADRGDDRKYAKAVKKEIKLLKKEHKILRKEGQSDKWSNALNKTLDQEDKRHALEDKIGRERAGKVNDRLRAKRNKSIKTVIKRKIDSITPEQKAKAKKVAVTALKVAGAVAITAAAAYAGYKGGIVLSKAIKGGLAKKAVVARVVSNNAGRDYLGKSARLRVMGPGHSIGKKKLTIDAKKAYSTFTNQYGKAMAAKNRYDRYNRFSKYTPLDVGASAGVVAGYALASNASKKKKKNIKR